MSDTPRTDALISYHGLGLQSANADELVSHARTLERELSALQAEVARMRLSLERIADCEWAGVPQIEAEEALTARVSQ